MTFRDPISGITATANSSEGVSFLKTMVAYFDEYREFRRGLVLKGYKAVADHDGWFQPRQDGTALVTLFASSTFGSFQLQPGDSVAIVRDSTVRSYVVVERERDWFFVINDSARYSLQTVEESEE